MMRSYPNLTANQMPQSQQGVVLLEALIGILIFSLGLLALTGLQAAMIKNTDAAQYRAEASFVAQQKISEIWLNEGGNANIAGYIVTNADVDQLPNGSITVAVAPDNSCVVTVTVDWEAPGGAPHQYVTNATVQGVSWC